MKISDGQLTKGDIHYLADDVVTKEAKSQYNNKRNKN